MQVPVIYRCPLYTCAHYIHVNKLKIGTRDIYPEHRQNLALWCYQISEKKGLAPMDFHTDMVASLGMMLQLLSTVQK